MLLPAALALYDKALSSVFFSFVQDVLESYTMIFFFSKKGLYNRPNYAIISQCPAHGSVIELENTSVSSAGFEI